MPDLDTEIAAIARDLEPETLLRLMLETDVSIARKELEHDDNPYTRRAFVRAAFAAIEGETHVLPLLCQVIIGGDIRSIRCSAGI